MGNHARPLFAAPFGWRGYLLGVMLGFIPCGLVYGALVLAAATGAALNGGAVMLVFGLGTGADDGCHRLCRAICRATFARRDGAGRARAYDRQWSDPVCIGSIGNGLGVSFPTGGVLARMTGISIVRK